LGFNDNKFISPLFKLFGKPLAGVPPDPSNLDIIQFNSTTGKWELVSGVVGSAVQSSSNVGSGEGLALARVGDDLPFKSLVAGAGIDLQSSATEVTINATGELLAEPVRNVTGFTIPKGTPVYIVGEDSGFISVAPAKADSLLTMATVGVTDSPIANNSNGSVIINGELGSFDTTSFSLCDFLFVSATVAGGLTATSPLHPNLQQFVGVVTNVGVTGKVAVSIGGLDGDEQGTILNKFGIGDGLAGAKRLNFVNLFVQGIEANPTANRLQTLQDKDGIIALLADTTFELLKDVTLGATADVFNSGTFPARQLLVIYVILEATGGSLDTNARLNNDSGVKYSYRRETNFTAGSTFTNDTEIEWDIGTPDLSQFAILSF